MPLHPKIWVKKLRKKCDIFKMSGIILRIKGEWGVINAYKSTDPSIWAPMTLYKATDSRTQNLKTVLPYRNSSLVETNNMGTA